MQTAPYNGRLMSSTSSSAARAIGSTVKALAVVTGIALVYEAYKFVRKQYGVPSRVESEDGVVGARSHQKSETSLQDENRRLKISLSELESQLYETRQQTSRLQESVYEKDQIVRRIRQPFRFLHDDIMSEVLEFLYMEELCSLLGTSSWFRCHLSNSLHRRKCVFPDVRHQKWGKLSSLHSEDWQFGWYCCRTNFDDRDARAWCSQYVAAIARHCKNVETVESGALAKERFQLKRTDENAFPFEEFLLEDMFFFINNCPKILHVDGIVGLHVAQLDMVTVHTLPNKALKLVFDLEWTARVDALQSFLAKCVGLEYLELVDGTSDGDHLSLKTLLSTSFREYLTHVQSLKISNFILSDLDVDSVTNAFPSLTALALHMKPTSRNFLMSFLSTKDSVLSMLDLTFDCSLNLSTWEEYNELLFLSEISTPILAREVTIKVLTSNAETWEPDYALCFQYTEKLSIIFLSQNHDRNDVPDADSRDVTSSELHHLDLLQSRYSFGIEPDEMDACGNITRAIQTSAPWIKTLHVAFVDKLSMPKFGLHERYSPVIEKRALDIRRGTNMLLPEEEPQQRPVFRPFLARGSRGRASRRGTRGRGRRG